MFVVEKETYQQDKGYIPHRGPRLNPHFMLLPDHKSL